MDVISIAGYITDEKIDIARGYLEKFTREACGANPEEVEMSDAALLILIENYCREAGVRNLQKQIEKIYRKIVLQLVRQGDRNEPVSKGVELVESTKGKAESDDEYAKHVSETDTSSSSDDNENSSDGEAAETNSKDEVPNSEFLADSVKAKEM